MKKFAVLLVAALACSLPALAEGPITALVVDSGTDFTHQVLKPLANAKAAEAEGQPGVDDDKNGYIDDVYGWNFVENNNVLVDLKNTPAKYDEVLECMRLINILQAYGKEALKPEEFQYLVKRYNDQKFWPWVDFVGGWAHGTHCAGIIATDNTGVRLNSVRHLATGEAPQQLAAAGIKKINEMLKHRELHAAPTRTRSGATRPKVTLEQLEELFTNLGNDYVAKTKEEADYLGAMKARVMNCSFGTDNSHLLKVFKQNMVQEWGWQNPSDAEVQKIVNLFVEKALLPRDKAMFGKCNDTLIFIAAGNSSEDLDGTMSSPNDVDLPNKIVIAATMENQKLAEFSCHGTTKVDVAVPGVMIHATYPNGKMGYMSGTSMACPMAARFATQVMQTNPNLNPIEVKEILFGTVDKKDWLADKVRTGGVINVRRACYAAQLAKSGTPLAQAIAEARKAVADAAVRSTRRGPGPNLKDKQVRDLYFSAVF